MDPPSRRPLRLPLPTDEERRQHRRGKLDDPRWEVLQQHARDYPNRKA
ncbi:hypothetical protein [Kitasatospora sp. NPDC058190]